MLHKLKTVKPKSLLMFSTSLVALLIISPLLFCIHSGSWISKWSKSYNEFTSTFSRSQILFVWKIILLSPCKLLKINHKDLDITNSEENPFCNWSIMFFTCKGITTLSIFTARRAIPPYKILFCMVIDIRYNF